jgi:iron complex transport system substrate-binding protein
MIDKIGCSDKLLFMFKKILIHCSASFARTGRLLLLPILVLSLSCQKNDKQAADSNESAKRYVVLSPELAEIIGVIEGTDNIAGRTEECNYPPQILAKPVVGKFGAVSRELILNLKPDIVFASSLEQQAIGSELSKLGIRVMTVYPKSIEEMLQAVIRIGDIIGKPERAQAVSDSLRHNLQELRKNIRPGRRPKVYLEIYSQPLMSVSDQSFVGSLIEWAGGDNIFPTLERDYSRIKAEDVIRANPDIIICYSKESAANIKKRLGWQNIPAVKNDMIFDEIDLNPDLIMRAGPRIISGMEQMQKIMFGVSGND